MIEARVFARVWSLMCERWKRDASTALAEFYHETISEHMDTEAFSVAAKRLLSEAEFFPAPADFWTSDDGSDAMAQWELCERVMQGERHVLDRMSPEGQRVVALLGGPATLGMTPLDRIGFVRKDFLGMYGEVRGQATRHMLEQGVTPESRRIVGEVMDRARLSKPAA